MALVIEDGSIVAGANSFVSRAEVISYASARGITLPDDETTDVLAIRAMDYLLTQCFKGDLVAGAEVPYPRSGLVTGDTAEDYVHSVPTGIKLAQMQLSLDAHNGVDLTPSATPSPLLKRSKVGPLEREFFAPGVATLDGSAPLTVATALLAAFVCDDSFSLKTIRV